MSKEPTFSVYSPLSRTNIATGFKSVDSAEFFIEQYFDKSHAKQMRVIEEKAKK